jgi:hypothetical protein
VVDETARLDRRPKLFIAVSTPGILLLVTAFAVADLWSLRGRAVADAEKRASNLALVLSEYLREIFAAGDSSIRQLGIYSPRGQWHLSKPVEPSELVSVVASLANSPPGASRLH